MQIRFTQKIFMAIVFLSFGKLNAQTAYSLIEAQDFAAQNNYQVKNAKADLEIAKKKIAETTAIGLPQVSTELNFQNFIDIPTQVIPKAAFNPYAKEGELEAVKFGTDYNSSASVTASQLVFSGEYIVGLQASKTYSELSAQNLERTARETRTSVALAYFTVLIAEENKKVLSKTLENTVKVLKETTAIYKSGFVEESDVDQLALLVSNLKNAVSRIDRQIEIAYMLLKLQMGIPVKDVIQLKDNIDLLVINIQSETIVNAEFSPENHIEFKLMDTQKELSNLSLKREKARSLPTFGAFFSHSQNAFRNEFDFFEDKPWYPATIWGFNMKFSIFSSGMSTARIKQAKLELEKMETMQEQISQGLNLQSAAAKSDFQNAADLLNTQKQNLVLAEKIQDKTLKKYKEGLASSFELNQVQNQYLSTQSSYVNAVFELLNAEQKLVKALGL